MNGFRACSPALVALSFGATVLTSSSLRADEASPPSADTGASQYSLEELTHGFQNPISEWTNIVLQDNTEFAIGNFGRARNTLNIQPSIPIPITPEWNIVSRSVLPLITQPRVNQPSGEIFGLGDFTESLYVTPVVAPADAHDLMWGFGPSFVFPTATSSELGSGIWGVGPTVAFVTQPENWSVGALIGQIWSVLGPSDRASVNATTVQYFVNYNLPRGWYLDTTAIVTADWNAALPQDTWTIPFGGGGGKVMRVDGQPLSVDVGGYWNAIRPRDNPSPAWQMRVQVALLFPK